MNAHLKIHSSKPKPVLKFGTKLMVFLILEFNSRYLRECFFYKKTEQLSPAFSYGNNIHFIIID